MGVLRGTKNRVIPDLIRNPGGEPPESQFVESSRRYIFENDLDFKIQLIGFNPVNLGILKSCPVFYKTVNSV